jgi:hypothetical protein
MILVKLNNWSVSSTHMKDPYIPPECGQPILQGIALNHPEFPKDSMIYTTPIIDSNRRRVTAQSRVYRLGCIILNIENGSKPTDPIGIGEIQLQFLNKGVDYGTSWTNCKRNTCSGS